MATAASVKPQAVSTADKGSVLRRGSQGKKVLKEKIVQIYEAFLRGEDPSTGNPNFWDEVFLLKANTQYLENELEKLNGEQLAELKDVINNLFYKCVEALKQDSPIRSVNAIQTLCSLVRGVFQKTLGSYGFDVINILIGFDAADHIMQTLVDRLNTLLLSEHADSLKRLAIGFLLVLVTATDNISQNTVLEYIMMNSAFESIIQILGIAAQRHALGHDAILLLTLLVQYRKYESVNPYIVKLSILDDELALTGYAQVVSTNLSQYNQLYSQKTNEPAAGFLATLSSMVGNMFVAEEAKAESVKANDSILLALYEAIHVNRNFITTLTHTHTSTAPVSTPPISPTATVAEPFTQPGSIYPLKKSSFKRAFFFCQLFLIKWLRMEQMITPAGGQKPNPALAVDTTNQPTNLLATFLEYCSVVSQDIRDPSRYNNTKLCFIILTCIVEDQYANSLMHDANMNFRVTLHKMPMRHRKGATDKKMASRPLASAVLDLMVEFIASHMMKNFPTELYTKCLGITHRILCYQKKCRVRLPYCWRDLWTAVINLVKFVLSNETVLVKKLDIFMLATRVVNIFNLFITYGDTFLPNPTSYDELYYEIIRMHQVFENLHTMALRYTTTDGQWKESAIRLTNAIVNIRAIVNHFNPKVESWTTAHNLSSLTEEQVLEIVRGNYDSLTLKMQDSLDQFERYTEKPKEVTFFSQLVRDIVVDVRKATVESYVRSSTILQECLGNTSPTPSSTP